MSTSERPAGKLATRTVTGVVSGMVAATAMATAVGFWLSYSGLHTFAIRAGLTGPEAWAWPASVDLFIAAGEAGVTISALRRHRDWGAWAYLALGFAASVTGNVLHVDTGHLAWTPYAVAAVPPMAAMLALAALLRHVYRIAVDRHEVATAAARRVATGRTVATAATRSRKRPKVATRRRSAADTEAAVLSALATRPDMTNADLAAEVGTSERTARRYRRPLETATATGEGR